MTVALVILAKAPLPGLAKTRLARTIGNDAAAALARQLLEHTLATAQRSGLAATLCGSPAEHPLLVEMARSGTVKVYGLNYKDKREDALGLLRKSGDPYVTSLSDTEGLVGIDYGVYGVPETFVIDKQGVIRFKQIGPITREALRDTLLPKLLSGELSVAEAMVTGVEGRTLFAPMASVPAWWCPPPSC